MKRLPSTETCYVCGTENPVSLKMVFYLGDNGEVVSDVAVPEQYEGYPGFVHGGNITAMLDEASGRACNPVDDPLRMLVTSQIKVKFLLPVPTNTPLRVSGRLTRQRGRLSYARGEIRNGEGQLLAESEGIFVDVSERYETIPRTPAETGWEGYPDEHITH